MRAREPEVSGYITRGGIRVYYESHGDGGEPIVFVPTDVFVTGEMWKSQVPYLARRHRVVVIDPRGNGRSDRPTDPAAYADREMVADLIAVMDELGIDRAVLAGLCEAGYYALAAASWHPDRASGVVAVAPWAADGTPRVDRGPDDYDDPDACWTAPDTGQRGWHMRNREVWLRDWPSWPAFFFGQMVNDPHSSKLYEDLVGWACQSNGAAQVAADEAPAVAYDPATTAALLAGVRCPVLVIHGTLDFCQPLARGAHLARLTGGDLLAMGGAGHVPTGRDPVAVNHAIEDFARRVHAGHAAPDRKAVPRVRAHLSTRNDPPPPLGAGTRMGAATRYGEGAPGVVVLPSSRADAVAWSAQLPGVARQLPLLVLDEGVTDVAAVREVLRAAKVRDAVLAAPPGTAVLAAELACDIEHLAAIVVVQAPAALLDQPGLLEFFVQRLPRERAPAAVVRALADTIVTDEQGRAPIVAVVDDPSIDPGPVDAVVTVQGGVAPRSSTARRRRRTRSVLYLSSPIGLGHVRRDLAIAQALRRRVDGLRVDWLTQPPVTTFLQRHGERVHPASAFLAAESAHIESEAGEHDLHVFQAIRRMDEILVNNFHVFDDLVATQSYDAWIGDEAWDVDHFLHENPRLKRAPFVWMTDFVGWVPIPDGGQHEADLAADYNAEMIEHVARYPGLRDRSVFVGDPDDVLPGAFGPGLPDIRDWTGEHYAFAGYVLGETFDPADRDRLRASLGFRPDEVVCVVSVGGSGVGWPLLRLLIDAYPACRARVPGLRMEVVTGPRLDPTTLRAPDGVTVHGFLPDLHRHHAACDVAIVQGGLSTTMELTAAGRPFLYFPLRHHFEQQFHVRHRLARHRAGRAMDYATADPDAIADALVTELSAPRDYLPVPGDGAARAAALVAEVL